MTRLEWGKNLTFPDGLDRGVLYLSGGAVAWNGLISVDESTDDEVDTTMYFDGVRYVLVHKGGDFKADVSAYMFPTEFEPYEGLDGVRSGQIRPTFNLSYRTGSVIHLVYNATVLPSVKSRKSNGQLLDPMAFNWTLEARPVDIPGAKPSAHLVIDTEEADPSVIAGLEDLLYGSATQDAVFPTVQQLLDLFVSAATLIVTDHGDGTWSATGPSSMIQMIDATTFAISTPSAEFVNETAVPERGFKAAAAQTTTPTEETTYVIRSY